MTLVQRTVEIALSQEGVHEVGENWGPKVKEYLAAASVDNPAPWCAAFVNWCAEQAAKELEVKSPLELVPNQAYVQSYVDYAKAHGWVVDRREARTGDLICVWHQSLKRYGHIGLVTGWTTDSKLIRTIEGNTNDDGSREGYEVAKRDRTPTTSILILRWS
jgi:hypothetical protein